MSAGPHCLPLLDLPPLDLPDFPLHQPAHSLASVGAFDTVGAGDHQSLLLDLLDLVEVDLLALLVPFQSDQSPALVASVVVSAGHLPSHWYSPGLWIIDMDKRRPSRTRASSSARSFAPPRRGFFESLRAVRLLLGWRGGQRWRSSFWR